MNAKQEKESVPSKAKQFWQENEERIETLKGHEDITPIEWKEVVYETWAISLNYQTGPMHGGTASSSNFRVANALLQILKSGIKQPEEFRAEQPSLDHLIELTEAVVENAREGMRIHNAQSNKFFGYDIETGQPMELEMPK